MRYQKRGEEKEKPRTIATTARTTPAIAMISKKVPAISLVLSPLYAISYPTVWRAYKLFKDINIRFVYKTVSDPNLGTTARVFENSSKPAYAIIGFQSRTPSTTLGVRKRWVETMKEKN